MALEETIGGCWILLLLIRSILLLTVSIRFVALIRLLLLGILGILEQRVGRGLRARNGRRQGDLI
jgi:hypothetical protein